MSRDAHCVSNHGQPIRKIGKNDNALNGLRPARMVYGFEELRQKYIRSEYENGSEDIFLRIDNLNEHFDLMCFLDGRFKDAEKNELFSKRHMESYRRKAAALADGNGRVSQTEALAHILSWVRHLSEHADQLTFESLIKHDRTFVDSNEDRHLRLWAFLNKNLPAKAGENCDETNIISALGDLLNENKPNRKINDYMKKYPIIKSIMHNALFRKVSKLGLDWAQSNPAMKIVFVEGTKLPDESKWRDFGWRDAGCLNDKHYKINERVAAYFPITYSEMKHLGKRNYRAEIVKVGSLREG